MEPKAFLPLLGLFFAACSDSTAVEAASGAGRIGLTVPGGKRLTSYSWEGAGTVPWLAATPPAVLERGELGRTAQTGLYLTFNASVDEECARQPAGWKVDRNGVEPAQGRFGGGARLTSGSRLDVTLPEDEDPRAWTIEFWLFPDHVVARDLLEIPGLLRVRTEKNKLVATIPGARFGEDGALVELDVTCPGDLEEGRWHHVGIAFDEPDLHGVRLVVDGRVKGSRLDAQRLEGTVRELHFGDFQGKGRGIVGRIDELRVLLRCSSTEELTEHWRLDQPPVQRVRLDYGDSSEDVEVWREPVVRPELDLTQAQVAADLEHAFLTPAGLTRTSEFWKSLPYANRPAPRTTHAMAYLGDQRVFVFGGETRDTHFGRAPNTNDTWIYDGKTGDWTRCPTPPELSPRCHLPAAFSPDHDVVFMVGGWWQGGSWTEEPETRFQEAWLFHVSERRWERCAPPGERISDHGLVYLPRKKVFLLLTAGYAAYYDPEQDLWMPRDRYTFVGGRPDQRRMHSFMSAYEPNSGKVLLFGGQRGDDFFDRTAFYDPDQNTVEILDPPLAPSPRVRGALGYDPRARHFVLFGGVKDQRSDRFDDLWVFDPRAQRWSEVPREGERPSTRGGFFGLPFDDVAGHFVLPFGRSGFELWQDETLALDLDDTVPGRARFVFDRRAFPERVWFAEAETPGDSAVGFRFRPSEDGLRFGEWSEECPAEAPFVQVEAVLRPGTRGERPLVSALGFHSTP